MKTQTNIFNSCQQFYVNKQQTNQENNILEPTERIPRKSKMNVYQNICAFLEENQ